MKKLTQEQKEEILALKGQEGMSTYIVAEKYDVSHVTIWHIWNPQAKNNSLDTQLAKKLIKLFKKKKIVSEENDFTDEDATRINELIKELETNG